MPSHNSTQQQEYYPENKPLVSKLLMRSQGKGVFIPFALLEITGDAATAIVFKQMLYWSEKMNYRWFYKSDQDWCNELHLTKRVIRRVIHGDKRSANGKTTLQDMGLEVETRIANGSPTSHYRINFAKLDAFLAAHFSTETNGTNADNNDEPLVPMVPMHCNHCRQSITVDYQESTLQSTETADAPLFSEPQAPTIQEKPTHKAMVGALLEAMGITTPTKADWGQAGRVAKELLAAELELSDAHGLVQHVRTEAAGKWRVTLNSLITKGRVSDYLAKRDRDYTIVESEPTAPLNMDEFLVDFGDEDVNSQ